MPFRKTLSLISTVTFLAASVIAGDQCYYLNGQPAGGVYRCDNTTSGESSCCNAGQICYSNGVCQDGPQNKATDWLRVGCTDKTWSSPACLKQCTTLVPQSSAGIRPCGGILTSDQYCCDTGSGGPGSLACCSNSSAIFAINPIPSIIATIPLNPTKAASSPSTGPSSSSSSNVLIPSSSVSSTTVTVTSASSTATTYASSNIPSSSYYFTSSNSTAVSSTSSTSAPASTSTKPAAATTTSSPATRFDSLGVCVSFGIAMLGGLVYAL